jgi:hypothetical protein
MLTASGTVTRRQVPERVRGGAQAGTKYAASYGMVFPITCHALIARHSVLPLSMAYRADRS